MPEPRRWLRRLKLSAVGLVDRGANQLAQIRLLKREGGMPEQDTKELQAALAAAKADLATVTSELTALRGGSRGDIHIDPFKKEYEAVKAELEKSRQELTVQLEQATKELADSRGEVVKIQGIRRRERFIKRAQELDHLPGASADDFAEILDHIEGNKVTAKDFEKLNTMLTSWNAVVEKSALFTEIGSSQIGAFTGAEGKFMALAKERAQERKVTFEKAYAQVMAEHPDLYRQYLAEKEK